MHSYNYHLLILHLQHDCPQKMKVSIRLQAIKPDGKLHLYCCLHLGDNTPHHNLKALTPSSGYLDGKGTY